MSAVHAAIEAAIENVSRRGFLKGMIATGGLVVAAEFLPARAALAAFATGADKMAGGVVSDPHVFVSIAPDGIVTIVAHRAEMGTGSRTSLPMVIADELEADWTRVRVRQSPGDEKKYGNQNTDGSRSLRHFIQPMRQCGAAARQMLEAAAAKRWGVDIAEVEAKNHEVVHKPSGRKFGYGELAAEAGALPTPPADQIKLKDEAAFRYLGKENVQIVDLFDITTGRAVYGIDTKLPGMKYAVVARPPVMGGKLASYDGSAAMQVPGVEKIVVIEGTPPPAKFQPLGGVAVIARNSWAAIKGREALKLSWDDGPHAGYDSVAYKAQLEATARKPGKVVRNDGDAEKALASAAKTVSAEYYIPHLAHASMEPPCATARVADGKCEVWAPVQSPGNARDELAQKLGLKPEDVTVNVTLLGRWLRAEVEMRLRARSGALVARDGRRAGQGRLDARGRSAARLSPYRLARTHRCGDRRAGPGRRLAAPQRRADDPLDLCRRSEARDAGGARHGPRRRAVRHPQPALRERRGRGPCPDRLVPLGLEHPARLCGAVLRRRDRRCPGPRPQGRAARADRAGAHRRPAQIAGGRRFLELRRSVRDLPDRHRTPAPRRRAGRRQGGVGQTSAAAARPGYCRRIAAS